MIRARHVALALLLVAVMTAAPPAARLRADEASTELAKYNEPVDKSIDRALTYLAGRQDAKTGHWPSNMGPNAAVTSLAVMAFLSKGYTPGVGPYGTTIDKGIDAVLGCVEPNGMLVGSKTSGPMYNHGIATLMLSEVSGMVGPQRQERIDKVLPAAVQLILTAQQVRKNPAHQGGWRYQAQSRDSDISCTGWSLMALRSARNNGSPIPDKAIDDAVAFVLRCRAKEPLAKNGKPPAGGVGFCYQPNAGPGLARTGTAVLCLELCGRHQSKEAILGGDWILANPARNLGQEYFYYGLYYCSQGMFQLGDRHWRQFAPHMYEMMLKFQRKDGSWPQAGGGEAKAGPCYSTAMSVLALAVSYRQLPIYQR